MAARPGRSRLVVALAAALLAGAAVIAWRVATGGDPPAPDPVPPRPVAPIAAATDTIEVAGTVRELGSGVPVANLRVMLRGETAAATAITRADGAFWMRVARGRYTVLVDGPTHVSVVRRDRIRLPDPPEPALVGTPDEALLPILDADADIPQLELAVARTGILRGRVVDPEGTPLDGAIVRALAAQRPATGQDHAVTGATGTYTLRLPAGDHLLEVSHPRIAGIDAGVVTRIVPGSTLRRDLVGVAGCVVSGRVVDAQGAPAGDGAIERRGEPGRPGTTDRDFGPAGRIHPGGRFRWASVEDGVVSLRAWPWRSPPSATQRFTCSDGARHDDVVLQLGDDAPALEGTLVDAAGAPVPFAFLDIAALDDDGVGQQERTDAEGRWHVYQLPRGSYLVTADVASGVVRERVTSPGAGVVLRTSGTGRIDGATTRLADGSIELVEAACADTSGGRLAIAARRLIPVRGGRFTIDGLPACSLLAVAVWRDQHVQLRAELTAGGVATVELDLGPPRSKRVRGIVLDRDRRPVDGAVVTASGSPRSPAAVRTDAQGRFELTAAPGADLTASGKDLTGYAQVGRANVDEELVEVRLGRGTPPADR